MTIDVEMKIVGELLRAVTTAAVSLTFRSYFTLMLSFPKETLLYYIVYK
jgi:hypothetical protein